MELKFSVDTKHRKDWFTGVSFSHPAKMSLSLQLWIIENYTKAGEMILDPMAGSGTVLVACSLGRNVIAVELEQKFIDIMKGNWEKIKQRGPQLGYQMGTCDIIQGDARQLEGLLCDKIITSPPFFNTNIKKRFKSRKELEEFAKKTKLYKEGRSLEAICRMIEKNWNADEGLLVDKCIFSPPYAEVSQKKEFNTEAELDEFAKKNVLFERGRSPEAIKRLIKKSWAGYPDNPGNIGNLSYGSIDKIVTSPPYAGSKEVHDIDFLKNTAGDMSAKYKSGGIKGHFASKEAITRALVKKEQGFNENPDNLGNLPYGNIDAVISSPPYENTIAEGDEGPLSHAVHDPNYKPKRKGYTEKIDAVVTSPPYEESLSPDRHKLITGNGIGKRDPKLAGTGEYAGCRADNIGNLKSDSYLEAMLQVYAQCWSVLKDGGLMILVTKNFIRNKQVVRLDTDTIKLCEQAGFTFFERHYRKLPSQSFWRVIYHQKHPEVEQINYEDVLVFRKMELKV